MGDYAREETNIQIIRLNEANWKISCYPQFVALDGNIAIEKNETGFHETNRLILQKYNQISLNALISNPILQEK